INHAGELQIPDILLFPGYTVRGTVRDSKTNEPLEGVAFGSTKVANMRDLAPILSDVEGRFEIPGIMPLPFDKSELSIPFLTMSKDGYATNSLMVKAPQPYSLDNTVIEHDAKLSQMTPEL